MTGRDVARVALSAKNANTYIEHATSMVEGDFLIAINESDSEYDFLRGRLEHENILGISHWRLCRCVPASRRLQLTVVGNEAPESHSGASGRRTCWIGLRGSTRRRVGGLGARRRD